MKRLLPQFWFSILVVLVLSFCGVGVANAYHPATWHQYQAYRTINQQHSASNQGYFFVLSAKSAVMKKTPDGYTFTLNQIEPRTLWFTDRPGRKAGHLATTKLISHWDQFFKKSQPNVSLVHANISVDKDGKAMAQAIELSHPVLNGDTVIFQGNKLSGDQVSEGTFTGVSVFVDSACEDCWDF